MWGQQQMTGGSSSSSFPRGGMSGGKGGNRNNMNKAHPYPTLNKYNTRNPNMMYNQRNQDEIAQFSFNFANLMAAERREELAVCVSIRGPDWGDKQQMVRGKTKEAIEASVQRGIDQLSFAQNGSPFSKNFEDAKEMKKPLSSFVVNYVKMVKIYCEALHYGLNPKAKPLMCESLQHCYLALRDWSTLYCNTRDQYENHIWMIPAFQVLLAWAREQAENIDLHFNSQSTDTNENMNKLVEHLRKIFGEMVREKQKRAGFLSTTTELVRCCLAMFQVSLVEQILRNVQQLEQLHLQQMGIKPGDKSLKRMGPGFPTAGVPPAVSVTLSYYWGVCLVQSGNYAEAERKISWGYSQLMRDSFNSNMFPQTSSTMNLISGATRNDHYEQKRQMLHFLIPLRIRKGYLPSKALLKKYELEAIFGRIINAIKAGDLVKYEKASQDQTLVFVKLGIVNLMSQVKHIVTRQFIRRIIKCHELCTAQMQTEFPELYPKPAAPPKSLKIDLSLVVSCFRQFLISECPTKVQTEDITAQYDSAAEVETVLSQLISYGGMKGYLTIHHNKLVVPRENCFPRVEDFCMQMDATVYV
ncbi:unnamed protein product [Amoebophrya sp. A120]|nr:unnamed protein product [Amoebophrya sp. A120]|eukprot:GSA120T00006896001.1